MDEDRPRYAAEWEAAADPSYLMSQYDSRWYALTLIDCFCDYTAKNAKAFASWWEYRTGTILDLGGGIGASTALLEDLAGAEVVFHSYGEGPQLTIARDLIGASTSVVTRDEKALLREVRPTAVFACELFEHVRDPFRLLADITEAEVDVICCANSFGAYDFGHWRTYDDGRGGEIPRDSMGREFAKELRLLGWRKDPAAFWNGRPSIWLRTQPSLLAS